MQKQRKLSSNKIPILVINETIEEFFERGKKLAKLVDHKKQLPSHRVISFEDKKDLVKFLAEKKIELVAAIRKKPNSVMGLAKTLKRSRAAVDKDIQLLESVGIIRSEYKPNPGHGRCKVVTTDKTPIKLQVQAVI